MLGPLADGYPAPTTGAAYPILRFGQLPCATPMRRFLAAIALALAILGAALVACGSGGEEQPDRVERDPRPVPVAARKVADLPNVIFIYSDDQALSDFTPETMPETHDLLVEGGTSFRDFVVATPLCCPSRATYLTGQYPHNTGVFSNRGGYRLLNDKFNTLPVWMRNAGYRTAWVGKYLQGYDMYEEDHYGTPAPGYDIWHATFEPRYYSYGIADDGEQVHQAKKPGDYYTSVITDYATQTIREEAKNQRPLFMTVNNLAPHTGTGQGGRCSNVVVPAPRDEALFKGEQIPRTPSFDEADVSDKPSFVQRRPLTKEKARALDLAYSCRLAALRGVDRGIAEIYDAVERTGELDNTVFIFTSDNGVLQGQHRLGGKNLPYEEGIHMPLAILAGEKAIGGPAAGEVTQLVANVDLAPTILELAKAKPCARPGNCRQLDGSSLVPLLRGEAPEAFGPDREILIEGGKARGDCFYAGIRTPRLVYFEYAEQTSTGCVRQSEVELYDLTGSLTGEPDPGQLQNVLSPTNPASNDTTVVNAFERLSRRLTILRACSGRSCRSR